MTMSVNNDRFQTKTASGNPISTVMSIWLNSTVFKQSKRKDHAKRTYCFPSWSCVSTYELFECIAKGTASTSAIFFYRSAYELSRQSIWKKLEKFNKVYDDNLVSDVKAWIVFMTSESTVFCKANGNQLLK